MSMNLFTLMGTIAVNNTAANNAIDDTTGKAETSESRISSAFKKIGAAVVAAFAVDKIVDFGKACVTAASSVAAEAAAFTQVMGQYAIAAQDKLTAVADSTGIISTRLTGYMTSLTAKFKGLGYDVEDATSLAARGLNIAADASAFWDKSLDEATGHLNSFINGSYEGGEAIGLFANDTQMAAYAVEKGIVSNTKAWSGLDEATKQATRLEYAENMMKLSGATGQAAKESNSYLNVQGNLTEAWRQFQGTIGEPILNNIVIPAMQKLGSVLPQLSAKVQEVINWFKEHSEVIKTVATVLGIAVGAVVAYKAAMATLGIINTVKTWLNGMTVAQKALNLVMNANPIGLVVTAIAALVAAFVVLYNKCEWFRNGVNAIWEAIKSGIQYMWNAIKPVITAIGNAFKAAVDVIKAAWNVVQPYFAAIWEGIKKIFAPIVSVFKNLFNGAWVAIKAIWDGVTKYFKAIFDGITNIFKVIKSVLTGDFKGAWEGIKGIWNAAGDFFKSVFNLITAPFKGVATFFKGIFSDAWNSITGIFGKMGSWFSDLWGKVKSIFKLPHFKIQGTLNPIKWFSEGLPKISIEWYAKGAVLKKPTAFGYNPATQSAMVGGEAGAEAVAPIETLKTYIREAVSDVISTKNGTQERILAILEQYFPTLARLNLVLDTGALVGELAPAMNDELGRIIRWRGSDRA